MRLSRTPYEAIIAGSAAELAETGRKIGHISIGDTVTLPMDSDGTRELNLVVREGNGLFLANWDPEVGLTVQGERSTLSLFAEQFTFRCEPIVGLHSHWDPAAAPDCIQADSLPIVVQLA